MTYDELLDAARRSQGKTLKTWQGREFKVGIRRKEFKSGISRELPFFTPASTGVGRSDGRKAAERFLSRFNETGSTSPGDYQDVTRNASYYVILVRQ